MPTDEPSFCLGRLFFNQPTPWRDRHPNIVASDSSRDANHVVVVNVSTKRGPDDPSCIVDAKEHAAVSERSYVRCERAGVTTLDLLEQGLRAGVLSLSTPVSGEVLKRVQQALLDSQHTRLEVKRVLRDQGF